MRLAIRRKLTHIFNLAVFKDFLEGSSNSMFKPKKRKTKEPFMSEEEWKKEEEEDDEMFFLEENEEDS